jgi:hypothetical protein
MKRFKRPPCETSLTLHCFKFLTGTVSQSLTPFILQFSGVSVVFQWCSSGDSVML